MSKRERNIEVIDYILKTAVSTKSNYGITGVLFNNDEYKGQEIRAALKFLEDESLLTFSNPIHKDTYQLTDKGYYAEELGYNIYCKEIGDKEKENKKLEVIRAKKEYIDYKNAKLQKYGFWINLVLAVGAIIISIIALKN
ncbi:MAG: hypothetical protein K0S53_369 [Bacteroidetes bacterium]|jgi:predicted transcriptional regulator|nr:hypothetical protein [Bacteroidota bacterium]